VRQNPLSPARESVTTGADAISQPTAELGKTQNIPLTQLRL